MVRVSIENKVNGCNSVTLIVALFIGVILVWATTFCLYFLLDSEKRGQFGDMFGAVNALFSGLAFAGLIITLYLYRKELSLQREELEHTRGEFVMQNKTMKLQRFENTFFNLLSLHQKITDNLEYSFKSEVDYLDARGRDVFKIFYFGDDLLVGESCLREYLKDNNIESFKKFYGISVFNHYFHYFDGIIDYIDRSELIDQKERYQYAVMLRNTLSDSERYLLFYYYAAYGRWHKVMAEEYSLFNGLNRNGLAKDEHYNYYKEEAFNHYNI